ncbi:MAG: SUMF1/EgtB/PvdO family nonheme iron enzyme [Ferruginibacter sp.]
MKKLFTFLSFVIMTHLSIANNVTTANVSVGSQNTSLHYSMVKFDIAWENSWRTVTNESNYDGCWIFVKFRKKNTYAWQHATFNYVSPGTAGASGHTEPSGSTISTPSDGKGIFIYRNAVGNGNINWTGAQLRWNYGADGVADNDSVEIKLFAVEVVYVPQGSFYLGSNGTEPYHLRRGDKDTCFNVTSENALTVGTLASDLFSASGTLQNGTIPALYPKGFNSFWCMKYEISQQQYADFLNTLDAATATTRTPSAFTTGSHPALIPNQPERAMNSLSNDDVLSLLDWSALRPMTELEYEKACRGANQAPVPNEYAWGNTTIEFVQTPTDIGLSTETWASGNIGYNNSYPIRCGALATSTSTRQSSGGSFYGIMEMSGNIYEIVVSADVPGRTFISKHGDGNLGGATQNFDVAEWYNGSPGFYGYRGDHYGQSPFYYSYASISSRVNYMTYYNNSRLAGGGGRGVRTAE